MLPQLVDLLTFFPNHPLLYDFIASDAESSWTLVEITFHQGALPDVASARASAFSLLSTILAIDIDSIRPLPSGSFQARPRLRYGTLWSNAFAHIAIDDHSALNWLLSLLSPLFILPTDKIPAFLLEPLEKHLNEIALCLNTTGLLSLVEGQDDRRIRLIQVLFGKSTRWSVPIEKLLHLAYHHVGTAAQFVVRRWPIQAIEAISTIISTIDIYSRYLNFQMELDRLLALALSVPNDEETASAHMKASKALYGMITRFLDAVVRTQPGSAPSSMLITKALRYLEQSGCVQLSYDLDATLRDLYSRTPEHPAKRLIVALDDSLHGALMLDTKRRVENRCGDAPAWMRERQQKVYRDRYGGRVKEISAEAAAAAAATSAAEVAEEVAAFIAKSKTQRQEEPRGWPFGPPELVGMYHDVLQLLLGRQIDSPPEPQPEDFLHYQWHIAVECFHSIQSASLPTTKLTVSCRASPETHTGSLRWALLRLVLHPRQVSESSIVVVKSTAGWTVGVMRKTSLNVIIAIPKASLSLFQAEIGGVFDGSLLVSIGEFAK